MILAQCVLLLLLVLVACVHSAKILCVFTVASVSHQKVFQPIWKELSLRGHQVTVLSPNILNDSTLTNLTEIDLSFMYGKHEEFKIGLSKDMDHWKIMDTYVNVFLNISTKVLLDEKIQNFIKNNNTSYDVVLAEVVDLLTFAFAAKCNCPLIGVASNGVLNTVHNDVGNPVHPIIHPDMVAPYYRSELNFIEKPDAVLFEIYERYIYNYICFPTINLVAKNILEKIYLT